MKKIRVLTVAAIANARLTSTLHHQI